MAGLKIRKGDRVVVLAGKDRGRTGVVSRAMPAEGKVIVDGLNVVKKHQKPKSATIQGGIIDKEMPMPVSRVAILCDNCGRTRVGYRFDGNGDKVRICRKCGGDL